MSRNKKTFSIGIIGKGFVGNAVAHGFSHQTGYGADIKIYDVDPEKSQNSLEETVNGSEFIFLSVPTPADKNGFNDLSIVRKALSDVNVVCNHPDNIILVRSTIVPGTTRSLQKEYPKLRIIYGDNGIKLAKKRFNVVKITNKILLIYKKLIYEKK